MKLKNSDSVIINKHLACCAFIDENKKNNNNKEIIGLLPILSFFIIYFIKLFY
jgi:hypothetical protein